MNVFGMCRGHAAADAMSGCEERIVGFGIRRLRRLICYTRGPLRWTLRSLWVIVRHSAGGFDGYSELVAVRGQR